MGLFSMSGICFSPSFFSTNGRTQTERGTKPCVLFCFGFSQVDLLAKTKPRAPALPLTETQQRDPKLKTKSTSHGALRFGLDITKEDTAKNQIILGMFRLAAQAATPNRIR